MRPAQSEYDRGRQGCSTTDTWNAPRCPSPPTDNNRLTTDKNEVSNRPFSASLPEMWNSPEMWKCRTSTLIAKTCLPGYLPCCLWICSPVSLTRYVELSVSCEHIYNAHGTPGTGHIYKLSAPAGQCRWLTRSSTLGIPLPVPPSAWTTTICLRYNQHYARNPRHALSLPNNVDNG